MTPLHVILQTALDRAHEAKPSLTESAIAQAAGIHRQALSRAKGGCRPETLAAVLKGIAALTGLEFDIELRENAAVLRR